MTAMKTYQDSQNNMIESQLISRGIKDQNVLNALRKIPRHKFVPKAHVSESYADAPQPIGFGQTISQPYIVALMLEKLQLSGSEKVLEVGSGSGYVAALLAELSQEVYAIEVKSKLASVARKHLDALGYKKINLIKGDGSVGYKPGAPYDRIIVSAAAPIIPDQLIAQLSIQGIMVIPVGGSLVQTLIVGQKTAKGFKTTNVCECSFVPLLGHAGWDS